MKSFEFYDEKMYGTKRRIMACFAVSTRCSPPAKIIDRWDGIHLKTIRLKCCAGFGCNRKGIIHASTLLEFYNKDLGHKSNSGVMTIRSKLHLYL